MVEELLVPFKHLVSSIYLAAVCFLDANQLNQYLKLFYKIFGDDPKNPKDGDLFGYDHYWSGEQFNVFLSNIRQFMSVFSEQDNESDRYKQLSGIQYLETILDNTASIISNSGKNPTSEAGVYKSVKNVIEAIFPTSINPKSNFMKTAKQYFPDILIPELKAAVEYKYAKTENVLKSTIEQIAADAKGYTGDKDYNVFYAVFYVTEDFWGEEKFKQVWKGQEFPKNWISFYKVGK